MTFFRRTASIEALSISASKSQSRRLANSPSGIGYVQGLILALVVTAVVTIFPHATAPVWAIPANITAETFNDQVCNLEDGVPANHVTSASAFVITGPDQFWEMTDCVSTTTSVYFRLGADIDTSLAVYAPTNSPVGYSTSAVAYSFRGVLDGAGKTITNVSMSSSTYGVGLFAALQNATVSDFAIRGNFATTNTDPDEEKYALGAGALAITTLNSVVLRRLTNSASVSGFGNVGGFVGVVQNLVSIDSIHNFGTVTGGDDHVGGLIGRTLGSTGISSSSNDGDIFGTNQVGGLIGELTAAGGEIASSVNSGAIAASGLSVGGLIGFSSGDGTSVLSSRNSGTVTGFERTGGLVGHCNKACSAGESSNTGNVSATEKTGGLVGFGITVNINDSSNSGTVSATGAEAGGLIGYSDYPTIQGSNNSAHVSGNQSVGGLVGWTWQNLNVDNSHNTGQISGSQDYVGGLGGWVKAGSASITESHNTGPVSGQHRVGGLVGFADDNANIASSYNTGAVVGSNYVGGVIGRAGKLFSGDAIFNTGDISGRDYVGGLSGYVMGGAVITDSYNVGAVSGSGTGDVGGITGLIGNFSAASGDLHLSNVYSAGTVSGTPLVDALASRVFGSLYFSSVYTTFDSDLVSASAIGQLQAAVPYTGWDFDNTWGFGTCSYNNGLPLLRFALEVSDYYSTGCVYGAEFDPQGGTTVTSKFFTASGSLTEPSDTTRVGYILAGWSAAVSGSLLEFPYAPGVTQSVTLYAIWNLFVSPSEPGQDLPPAPPPIPAYSGPTLDSKQSVIAGEQVSFTGRRLHYVSSAYAGTTKLTIVSGVSERLVLDVSSSMAAGSYDLVLFSSHGKLTFQQGLTITAPVAEVTPPAVIEPEAVKKLTVGSFKGFVAIYSKGYEGAKLSAKVAGKWQVVDGLDESFKGKNYSRTVRFAGAGYDILVHLYINGELIKTEELTTK